MVPAYGFREMKNSSIHQMNNRAHWAMDPLYLGLVNQKVILFRRALLSPNLSARSIVTELVLEIMYRGDR